MAHRVPRPLAAAAALALASVVAACSGSGATPTPSPITDPHQIIARSLLNLEHSHSFHAAGTISGSIQMSAVSGMIGVSLPLSGKLDLTGSTIAGDVDVDHSAAKATVAFPSLFGLSLDLIEVDGSSYTKINLLSDKYTKSTTDVSAVSSAAAAQASSGIDDTVTRVGQLMDSSGATATLAGHSSIDSRDALQLDLSIPPDRLVSDLRSFAPGLPQDAVVQTVSATYWVYADTLTPAQIEVKASSSTLGNLDVTVTLTKYDQAVTIQAPPADQVQ